MTIGFVLILIAAITGIVVLVRRYQYNQGYISHEPPITSRDRGTFTERRLINTLLNRGYKRTAIYHDLYLGKMSQVDAVLCTDVGLIVIEVKDYTGWLFGNGYNEKWTQVSGYGAYKYRFYNPVRQNQGHINALRKIAALKDIPMYSVIVFYGDCEFKDINNIPSDTMVVYGHNFVDAIQAIERNNPVYQYSDKWEVANALKKLMDAGSDPERRAIQQQNVQNYVEQNGLADHENHAEGFSLGRLFRISRPRMYRPRTYRPRSYHHSFRRFR